MTSDDRHAHLSARLRYELLRDHPASQAEYIAAHYCSLTALAKDLYDLIEMRRAGSPENLDWAIAHCAKQIQDAHKADLGIALEWPLRS